jgi:prefoldin subunit 5
MNEIKHAAADRFIPAERIAELETQLLAAKNRIDELESHADDVEQAAYNASSRARQVEAAIKKHRAQRADDKCWLDDQELASP